MDTRSIQLAKYKPWEKTEYELIFEPIRPRLGPEVIKNVSCSTQTSMRLILLVNVKHLGANI